MSLSLFLLRHFHHRRSQKEKGHLRQEVQFNYGRWSQVYVQYDY